MMTEFDLLPFQIGDKVRIKDHVDPLIYNGMTTIGNEAWIRDIKVDRWQSPMVVIEWDKNHWSYNGAPDGLTFAEHFEKVKQVTRESDMASQNKDDKDTKIKKVISNFAQQLIAAMDDDTEDQATAALKAPESDVEHINAMADIEDALKGGKLSKDEERFLDALEGAFETLSKAEAFIVVGVERFESSNIVLPYTLKFALTPEAELVADAFLSILAADSYQELASKALVDIFKNENADG
jgi:hypothetical protein